MSRLGGGHGLGVTRLPHAATLLVQIMTSLIRIGCCCEQLVAQVGLPLQCMVRADVMSEHRLKLQQSAI